LIDINGATRGIIINNIFKIDNPELPQDLMDDLNDKTKST
jgi:hypothetical protein